MKVALGTIVVDDDVRRALRAYHGKAGLATREEVRAFYVAHADAVLNDVCDEWRKGLIALYVTDECDVPCTFAEFIEANDDGDGGCNVEYALDDIRALAVGESHSENEGAGGTWTITRVG